MPLAVASLLQHILAHVLLYKVETGVTVAIQIAPGMALISPLEYCVSRKFLIALI